jgi:L-asparaginase
MSMAALPTVAVFSTGGTIASPVQGTAGAIPSLSAQDLLGAVPQLSDVARLEATTFRQVPSPELRAADLVELAAAIAKRIAAGARGAVVTQGTDSLEETAFALDLLVDGEAPVVLTAAMRNPSLPGADGPANLLAAVQTATSEAARGLGCLAVLNDEVHAARFVQKKHTSNPATFSSPLTGPIGWIAEGQVRIAVRPVERHHVEVSPPAQPDAEVALLKSVQGDDGRLVSVIEQLGYRGLVVEAQGGGHLPSATVEPLQRLAQAMPVVLSSRTGSGELLRTTYGFPGSEKDLLARGLIPAGALDGLKSRVLLTLLLMTGADRMQIEQAFELVGVPGQGSFRFAAGHHATQS